MGKRKGNSVNVLENDALVLGEAGGAFKLPAANEKTPRLRSLDKPVPKEFFQMFEAGDQWRPGVADEQGLQLWKYRVRFWCQASLKPDDCSAFHVHRGAVPGDSTRREEFCPRSEQYLAWCAAYWVEPVRGRWWTWSVAKRTAALSAARTLVASGHMEQWGKQVGDAIAHVQD